MLSAGTCSRSSLLEAAGSGRVGYGVEAGGEIGLFGQVGQLGWSQGISSLGLGSSALIQGSVISRK
jgi:hypothetical protein